MAKATKHICPRCGHEFGISPSGDLRTVQELWGEVPPGLRPVIRKVTDRIRSYCGLPSANDMEALLTIIINTDEKTLRTSLDRYHSGDHYAKGIRYLRATIQGIRKQLEQQRKMEREQYGTAPPKREIAVDEETTT